MKGFIQTFIISFILIIIFLFFGGYLILQSFWLASACVALVISILVTSFIHQETKHEELEARIKALELMLEEKDDR